MGHRWTADGGSRFTHRCVACGQPFESRRSHSKTCSARCRKRLSRGIVAPVEVGDGPVVLSLCDRTGTWSAPYAAVGYEVIRVDLADGTDVRLFEHPRRPIHGILAAPPCTVFCRLGGSTARTEAEMAAGLALVDACLRLVAVCRPSWWALENPPGHLERYLGPPSLSFEPFHYGDPWTKQTYLWGDFNRDLPRNEVEPVQRNRTVRMASKVLRSQTPPGFAAAFAAANP